jgi:hypothetical protein
MIVASTCLAVFVLTAWIRSAGRDRPLERSEVDRIRRFSEKMQREASMPFE